MLNIFEYWMFKAYCLGILPFSCETRAPNGFQTVRDDTSIKLVSDPYMPDDTATVYCTYVVANNISKM